MTPGVYLVTQYLDASKALLDKRLSNRPAPFALVNERNRETFVAADVARHLIAFQDAPEVIMPRRVLATELQAFCHTINTLLDDLADEIVSSIPSGGRLDFVEVVAIPFAVRAMCQIFGFPERDASQIKAWSEPFFSLFHAIPDRATLLGMNATLEEFRSYVTCAIEDRRAAPRDDLLTMLAGADADTLDGEALVDNTMLLVADAIENVWAGIANALVLLIENYQVTDEYLNAGGNWFDIVDECLRLESPSQYQGRIALEPMKIGDTVLSKYAVLLVGFAAANRDPSAFEDPEVFRPGRKGPRHLAFGLGRHACIGGTLVRMETASILSALWPLIPNLEIEQASLQWNARAGHRWLKGLPIRHRAWHTTT